MFKLMSKYPKLSMFGGAAILTAIGFLAAPYIQTSYKSHKSGRLLETTSQELRNLGNVFEEAERTVNNNSFLLVAGEERNAQYGELVDTKEKIAGVRQTVDQARQLFEAKNSMMSELY